MAEERLAKPLGDRVLLTEIETKEQTTQSGIIIPDSAKTEDVKRAIQTIADNYGKDYFPVIQSAKTLREKFTKIEDYVKRNNSPQKLTKDQQQDLINKQLEEMYANNQNF